MLFSFGWKTGQNVAIVVHDDTRPIDVKFYHYVDLGLPLNESKEIRNATELDNYRRLAEQLSGNAGVPQNRINAFERAVSLAIAYARAGSIRPII